MKVLVCPQCNNPLDNTTTQACTACGNTIFPIRHMPTSTSLPESSPLPSAHTQMVDETNSNQPPHANVTPLTLSPFSLLRKVANLSFHRLYNKQTNKKSEKHCFAANRVFSIPLTWSQFDDDESQSSQETQAFIENDLSKLRPDGQMTWQKIVERSPQNETYTYPPRPPVPDDIQQTQRPPKRRSTAPIKIFHRSDHRVLPRLRSTSSKMIALTSIVLVVISISIFALILTFTPAKPHTTNTDKHLSLLVTPRELSVGATMTMSGSHFSPLAIIGLTRDNSIPLADTAGDHTTRTDANGSFTDTVIIGDDWGSGTHIIRAEDSLKHLSAAFPITVDDNGIALRPPHLQLSIHTLDFGSGDQATNNTKTLTLLNSGSAQITWQANVDQPWLELSPSQDTFTRDFPQRVTVGVDRSKMEPGLHKAKINFTSNGGNESLAVSVQVTTLPQLHDAILQVSPAILALTAADGSSTTSSHQITVSNSGGEAMVWQASTNTSWLKFTPTTQIIAPHSLATIQVSAATGNLLPGTYTGSLTLTAQNLAHKTPANHSPQQVLVSVTITPACTLVANPSLLSFSSDYLQPAPSAKAVTLGASPGCQSALSWTATSNTPWITIANTRGQTPDTLSIGINPTDLTPNTYTGSVNLNSPAGTQTILVKFILGPASTGVISVGPSSLLTVSPSTMNVTIPGENTQLPLTVSNAGSSALNWSATLSSVSRLSGATAPAFISLSTTSGANLKEGTSTSLNVIIQPDNIPSDLYDAKVTITATNSTTGQIIIGSPVTVPITIFIRSPHMQLSTTNLTFSADTNATTASQTITISNTGGGIMSWTASKPTQSWLSLSTLTDNATMKTNSALIFSVQTTGLTANANAYTDQITITPNAGDPITITISLTITGPAPTSTSMPSSTSSPSP
jgi:hypothetical protein